MRHLSHLVLTLLGVLVSLVALYVFLIGVPLLVHRDLSVVESIGGALFYTALSLLLAYGARRLFSAARTALVA